MNKSDIKLICIVLIISLLGLSIIYYLKSIESDKLKKALVYYENKLILTIDLNIKEKKEYTVSGYNGDVLIKTEYGKVMVSNEKSPLNLCSKQGYIESSYETIVCLPNKIVIEIEYQNEFDTIVR